MHKNTLAILFFLLCVIKTLTFAQTNVDSLKSLVDKTQGKEKVKLLIKIGYSLSSDNPNEAIDYLDDAIELADQTESKWNKADALFNKGVALWHLGQIEESSEYYTQAKIIYEEFKDTLSLMKVMSSEAINHSMKGESDLALEKLFKSLSYAKKLGDRLTIFNDLFNLGIIFDNKGEKEKALDHYIMSIDYADDKGNLALVQNYIAEIYISQKKYSNAETYLKKAEDNAKLSKDSNSLVWTYTNLGNLNYLRNNFSKAEKYFLDALSLARKMDYKLDIIHSLTELGDFYNKTKNYQAAEKYLLEAYQISQNVNSLQDLSNTSNNLALVYYNLGNYKQAYEFLKANKEFSDSLFVLTNNEKVAEVETKYSVKQKEKEASILKKENELQKKVIDTQTIITILGSGLGLALLILIWILVKNRHRMIKVQQDLIQKNEEIETNRKEINEKNKELEDLNSTKDKFFSIVAHDLRNPIAAFVSISEILEYDFDRLNDKDKKSLLSQMNSSSKNLIRLLENLLTWARLSNNKIDVVKQKINLSDTIESAVVPYEHWANNKNIKLQLDVDKNTFIDADPFILQTIIGNLINNAIKFSNAGETVTIYQKSSNGSLQLFVKDNGIGIEKTKLNSLFDFDLKKTTRGTENESGTGLGLILVKDLVEKVNWKIEANSKVNEGSEFIITILN